MMCHLSNKEIREDTLQLRAAPNTQRVPTADEGRRVGQQRGGCGTRCAKQAATRQTAAGAWNADDDSKQESKSRRGARMRREPASPLNRAGRTFQHYISDKIRKRERRKSKFLLRTSSYVRGAAHAKLTGGFPLVFQVSRAKRYNEII